MSQKRTTTYTCDHCGKDQSRKGDLRRFSVIQGPNWARSVSFDVCAACEVLLIAAVAEYLPDGETPNDLSRQS